MSLTAAVRAPFARQFIAPLLLLAGFFSFSVNAETVPKTSGWVTFPTNNSSARFECSGDMDCVVEPALAGSCGQSGDYDEWKQVRSIASGYWICKGFKYRSDGSVYTTSLDISMRVETASVCPASHRYSTSDGQCSDVAPECTDMDTMTESCCSVTANDYCAANGGSVLGWELGGLGGQYCDYMCDFDVPDEPVESPPPESEEECEQAADSMCSARGGAYNYFWDAEYSSCAYSCNDNPEEVEQPPETDPANEPQCVLDNGIYTGECVDDDNPDNGNCTARKDENGDVIEGEFEGQCVVGDEINDSSRLDLANRHLLNISGGVKGLNTRLDNLPEKIAESFGLGDVDEMQSSFDSSYMKTAVRGADETERVGNWFRGLFGLGDETGMELVPNTSTDLSEDADNFTGLVNAPAACPAPVTFQALGQSYQIPYDSLCDFFILFKPIFLAGCFLMAGFIVFGSRPS